MRTETTRPPGQYRKDLENELEHLMAHLDWLNDTILELEETCDTTVDAIHRVKHSLAKLDR
jgi:hypothetical protein